ncbi:hypothetical protein C8F04DRAFT_1405506 [Mycena alexandri]|uniref:Uncharacterized protein n=1 Tax=Mycena alexandri TaxID=1745969 RepID=A0AAD6RYQ3_9AGAR|nr:hypothetical protein C8F04DRAFT_1405506 [Mycena alexandri]
MSSSVLSAGLIQAFLELTLYGVYFVIFSTVFYLFWHGPGLTKRPRVFVFLALVVQFLAITAHWINTMYGTYLPFVKIGGGAEAEQFYRTLGRPALKTHILLTEMTNTLTDCLVIHRLYVIWGYKLSIVAFPLLLLVVQVVGGIGSICGIFTQTQANFHAWSFGWVTANLVASLVISGYSTGMMSFKILNLGKMVRKSALPMSGRHRLTSILVIMSESAALQTAINLALLLALQLTAALEPNFVLKGIQAVVLGMSTVLIHARIGFGWTEETSRASTITATNPSAIHFTVDIERTRDVEEAAEETELGPYRVRKQ